MNDTTAEKMHSRELVGILEIAASGVGFGFLGLFGKAAYDAGLTAGENLSLRFLFSAALLWLWLLITKGPAAFAVPPKTLLGCAGLGAVGYAVFSSLYFEALAGLSASLTVLLFYTFPVMVALGSFFVLGQRPSRRALVSLPLIMIGIVSLVWGDFAVSGLRYVLFALGSAVLYAVYILASSRILQGIDPLVAVTYVQTFAGIALACAHLHDAHRVVTILETSWLLLLGIVTVSTVLPMTLFFKGLQKLDPPLVSLLGAVEPVTGVAMATLFLDERLGVLQWSGGALVLATLVYLATERRNWSR